MPGCRTWQDVMGAGDGLQVNLDSPQAVGLVGCWPLSGNKIGNDLSRYGRHGTPSAGLALTATEMGRAPLFVSASDNVVDTGKTDLIPQDSSFSVTAWIRSSATGGEQGIFSSWDALATPLALLFSLNGDLPFLVVRNGSAGDVIQFTGSAITTNIWTLTGCSVSRTFAGIYKNGKLDASVSGSPLVGIVSPSGSNYRIGFKTTGQGFSGHIRDVRLYRVAHGAAFHQTVYDPRTRYDLYWFKSRSAPKNTVAAGGQPTRKRWGGVPHSAVTGRGVW